MAIDIFFSVIFIIGGVILWTNAKRMEVNIKEHECDNDPAVKRLVIINKVAVVVSYGAIIFIAIIVFTWGILPILEMLLGSIVASIEHFLSLYGGYFIIAGYGVYLWKKQQPQKPNVTDIAVAQNVEVEFARQRGLELQKFMLAFLYRIIVATRSTTNATPPNDEKGIAVISTSGMSFYMVGGVVVYQAIVPINEDITEKVEDIIQDELQDAVPKYVNEFPELIDNTRSGYPEVEILTVRGVGRKVIIDAVIASEKSIPLIKARRIARIERRDRQDREGDAGDPLFK